MLAQLGSEGSENNVLVHSHALQEGSQACAEPLQVCTGPHGQDYRETSGRPGLEHEAQRHSDAILGNALKACMYACKETENRVLHQF